MAGQLDNSLTIDDPLRFPQCGLDDELVQRRTHQIGRMLKRVLHVLRHPGCDSAAFVGSRSRSHGETKSRSVDEMVTL